MQEKGKPSALLSFFNCKCPRCRKGEVFQFTALNLSKFTKTHSECSVCKLVYSPETGFFFGAMYWSYAMIVALLVTIAIFLYQFDLLDYGIIALPILVIVFLPFIFRYSRMLMLYLVYPVMYKDKFYKSSENK